MSLRAAQLLTGLSVGFAIVVSPALARAQPTKDQCIDSDAKAQDLRRDHKLWPAREQLLICAAPSCPALIRADCAKQLVALELAQPTVVFEVVDPSGARVPGVTLTLDGVVVARPDGATALPVDPGAHTLVLTAPSNESVSRTLVLAEGDRGHHERIVMGPAVKVLPLEPTPAPVATSEGLGTQRWLGIAAAGAGVVGVVIGGIFGAMTLSEKSQQESDCSGTCSAAAHAKAESDHATGVSDATVSTVGFIAGGVLLAGGAVLFFTAHKEAHGAAPAVSLAPELGPGGGRMVLQGRF